VAVLRNIQAALTREPYPGAGDERLDLMAVLHAYTSGGAWAAHREHVTGRLVPGLAADLVLLGGDIETTAPGAIFRRTPCGVTCSSQCRGRMSGPLRPMSASIADPMRLTPC
jgi:predicted amidohydrolase YtcJ